MKKLLISFQLIAVSAGAQVTLENTYSNAVGYNNFGLIQLSSSGYKYFENANGQVTLYNLNHSVFRTFTIPAQPFTPIANIGVRFISEELFNTNSSDVEYMIVYSDTNNFGFGARHIRVYDEFGSLLFSRDSADCPNSTNSPIAAACGVVYTSAGVKMIIQKFAFARFGSLQSSRFPPLQ